MRSARRAAALLTGAALGLRPVFGLRAALSLGGAPGLCVTVGLGASLLGCSTRDDAQSPEGSVRLLIAASRAGDRAAVFQRFGPRTRARVEEMLASASKLGGRRAFKPEDFVSVGWAPPAWEAAGVRGVRRDAEDAEVEVYSAAGDRQNVRLVREGKEWKVELPLR